jgi:hypothetical protein
MSKKLLKKIVCGKKNLKKKDEIFFQVFLQKKVLMSCDVTSRGRAPCNYVKTQEKIAKIIVIIIIIYIYTHKSNFDCFFTNNKIWKKKVWIFLIWHHVTSFTSRHEYSRQNVRKKILKDFFFQLFINYDIKWH